MIHVHYGRSEREDIPVHSVEDLHTPALKTGGLGSHHVVVTVETARKPTAEIAAKPHKEAFRFFHSFFVSLGAGS